VDIVTLAAQEIRRPLHRPREDKVQISRVTLADEEVGGRYSGRERTRYIT
jgi:3-hydroxy-3-methylglutaryl CoA synthase